MHTPWYTRRQEKSMPIYEYRCTECEAQWELEQSIKDEPRRVCPECGKQTAERQISLSNFQLVGDRWGKDGYT